MDVISEYQAVRDLMTDIGAIYVVRCRAARAAGDQAELNRWFSAAVELRVEVYAIDPWDEVAVPAMRVELRRRYHELKNDGFTTKQ